MLRETTKAPSAVAAEAVFKSSRGSSVLSTVAQCLPDNSVNRARRSVHTTSSRLYFQCGAQVLKPYLSWLSPTLNCFARCGYEPCMVPPSSLGCVCGSNSYAAIQSLGGMACRKSCAAALHRIATKASYVVGQPHGWSWNVCCQLHQPWFLHCSCLPHAH